jgi:hypothetical protein
VQQVGSEEAQRYLAHVGEPPQLHRVPHLMKQDNTNDHPQLATPHYYLSAYLLVRNENIGRLEIFLQSVAYKHTPAV